MNTVQKIKVGVLYGGRSAEHEVSLQSAANIIANLDLSIFEVIPIGIDKQGSWLLGESIFRHSLEHKKILENHHPDKWFMPQWITQSHINQKKISTEVNSKAALFDVIFPAVHGSFCEDGTLQGLLETVDVPYVGCGVLASAIGMDKEVSKRLIEHANIKTVPYLTIKRKNWEHASKAFLKKIEEQIEFPLFVKPANTGSSIGINKVKTASELIKAIENAFCFDTKILIEKALNVRELELAVLEPLDLNQDPIVSVMGEIKSHHDFYSYEAKYLDENGAELFIPAEVENDIQNKATAMAKVIFKTLECEGMARVDLFLDNDSQQLYFNEINTLPGFTQISMYPKLMGATGISYTDLLTHLIKLALERHKHKSKLKRNYEK